MRVFARFVATFILLLAAGAGQAEPVFSFPNPAGPFPVGFKAVHQYDHARAYRGETDPATGRRNEGELARPVQTLVWYPAAGAGAGPPGPGANAAPPRCGRRCTDEKAGVASPR